MFTAPLATLKFVELKEATPFTIVLASIPASVRVPPKATGEPDTEIPVPAVGVTVTVELARAEFAIELAGNATLPEEMVSPFDPVNNPAEVIVPVPVVEIFPLVEIVIFEARSLPLTAANVGSPAALP